MPSRRRVASIVHLLDRWTTAGEATAISCKMDGVAEATAVPLKVAWHAVLILHLLDRAGAVASTPPSPERGGGRGGGLLEGGGRGVSAAEAEAP